MWTPVRLWAFRWYAFSVLVWEEKWTLNNSVHFSVSQCQKRRDLKKSSDCTLGTIALDRPTVVLSERFMATKLAVVTLLRLEASSLICFSGDLLTLYGYSGLACECLQICWSRLTSCSAKVFIKNNILAKWRRTSQSKVGHILRTLSVRTVSASHRLGVTPFCGIFETMDVFISYYR